MGIVVCYRLCSLASASTTFFVIQFVLATLLHIFTSSPVTVWGKAASCCLQVWRDLSCF